MTDENGAIAHAAGRQLIGLAGKLAALLAALLAGVLALGLAVVLAVLAAGPPTPSLPKWLALGLALGLAAWLASWLTLGLAGLATGRPTRRTARRAAWLTLGLTLGLPTALALGFATWLASKLAPGLELLAFLALLTLGLAAWVATNRSARASAGRFVSDWIPRISKGLAVWIAGRERSAVDYEWTSHLDGLSRRAAVKASLGFILAALRYRLEDTVCFLGVPAAADLVLDEWGSAAAAIVIAGIVAVSLVHSHIVRSLAVNLGVAFGAMVSSFALLVWLVRRRRGVKQGK